MGQSAPCADHDPGRRCPPDDEEVAETGMTDRQYAEIIDRLDRVERTAVTRSDVFQAVPIVQGAWLGVIVGTVVVLAAVGAL